MSEQEVREGGNVNIFISASKCSVHIGVYPKYGPIYATGFPGTNMIIVKLLAYCEIDSMSGNRYDLKRSSM